MASTPRPPALPEKKAPTTRAEKKADKKANRVLPSWLPESRKTKERKAKDAKLDKDMSEKRKDPSGRPPVMNPYSKDSKDPKERGLHEVSKFKVDVANKGLRKAVGDEKRSKELDKRMEPIKRRAFSAASKADAERKAARGK